MDGDTMRVKAWPVSGSEPDDWMLSADDGDNDGAKVGVYSSRFTGNTNGTVAFVGLESITVTGLEWTGYVVSWPVRWDVTGNNSWSPITAGGILRRLRQGTNPTQSPLRHQLETTADVSGYWPMEEGTNAKYFLPVSPNTAAATFSGVSPGSDTSLAGSLACPVLDAATSSINAQVKTANGGNGMAAMVLFKIPTLPGSKTRIFRIRTSRGPASIWDFSVDATNTYIEAFDSTFTSLGSVTNAMSFDFTGKWIAWRLKTDNSGGVNTAYQGTYHEVEVDAPFYTQSGTISGLTNTIVGSMEITGIQGMVLSQLWLGQNTLPFVTSTFANVSAGWDGETAGNRFVRISGEAGIPCSVAGPNSLLDNTEVMGPQQPGKTMANLQGCADADYGVITERGAGLEFVPRASRWNLTEIMTLSLAAGQIAAIPQPTRDDQRLRNKWTVSRIAGSSATAQDSDSIDRNGTWEDSATINVYDDSVLENHAGWRVNIGTQLRLRWPVVGIDLARNPSLAEKWRQRFYGWRFGATTGLTQVKGNEPSLVMEGYQATLTPEVWAIDMMATDARVWTAGVADDTGIYGRADSEYCTTTSLISSTTLSIPITTTTGMPKWDNTAGLWSGGVDFNVGGEQVTVTSISNGGGQAQTLNATTRGVNGFPTTHASGTTVSLWNPARAAL
jgi:hypothetical protein